MTKQDCYRDFVYIFRQQQIPQLNCFFDHVCHKPLSRENIDHFYLISMFKKKTGRNQSQHIHEFSD